MRLFRRNQSQPSDNAVREEPELPDEPSQEDAEDDTDEDLDLSLEEIEENPELLAAEAAVNELPPPPATGVSWIQGGGSGMVTFPGPGPADDPALNDEAEPNKPSEGE